MICQFSQALVAYWKSTDRPKFTRKACKTAKLSLGSTCISTAQLGTSLEVPFDKPVYPCWLEQWTQWTPGCL